MTGMQQYKQDIDCQEQEDLEEQLDDCQLLLKEIQMEHGVITRELTSLDEEIEHMDEERADRENKNYVE